MKSGKAKLVNMLAAKRANKRTTSAARAARKAKREAKAKGEEGKDGEIGGYAEPRYDGDECFRDGVSSRDVRKWFKESQEEFMPHLRRLPRWPDADRKMAKEMLREFGPALMRGTIRWFWLYWDEYRQVSRGRLTGTPTVRLLYAMRSRVFADCQLDQVPGVTNEKRETVNRDEYDEERDHQDTGTDPFGW